MGTQKTGYGLANTFMFESTYTVFTKNYTIADINIQSRIKTNLFMRLTKTKANLLFAASLALAVSCADEEKVTPRSSSMENESNEAIVYDDPDFIAQNSASAGRTASTQNLPIKTFTVYLARTSNATAGSVNFKLYDGNTLIKQSSSKNVNTLIVWSGNLNDVNYGLLSYSPSGLELDTAKTYRLEIHCTGCESDANKQVVWWSANANQYSLGTGQTKTGGSWTSNNNDFSFKIQNVNSDGTTYTSRAQYTKEKVYKLNVGETQAQTFKPELGDNYIIQFPDAKLAAAVREEADIATEDAITYGQAKEITHLSENDIIDGVIQNLEGIQYLKNLQDLRLRSNVTTLAPLSGLSKLTKLALRESRATDMTPLASLTNLTDLELTSNINNVNGLGSLTNLTRLYINGQFITNIEPLEELTNLTKLYLLTPRLTDISPLEQVTTLTNLQLYCDEVANISSLSRLTNLSVLLIEGSKITSVTDLENLTKLEKLYLNYNSLLRSVQPLVNLPVLTHLELRSNQITDVLLLGLLDSLAILNLQQTPVTVQDQATLRNHLPNTNILF